jgi:uncharacterized protein DUF4276
LKLVSRVYVIVEGPTEESFVNGPLAEVLWPSVFVIPIIVGVPGHKGGRTSYARVQKDILTQLRQDRRSYCTTMIDYYGIGRGFPGTPAPAQFSSLEKVEHIECAVKDDIGNQLPDFRPDIRFIPYLSLHEYESLLFSDPDAFASSLGRPDLAGKFKQIRDEFSTPEDINNDPQTAPSKRVLECCPTYGKVIQGTIAARAVGIQRMREECAHFRAWLEQLQALPAL